MLELYPAGQYSMAASVRFLEGFEPAAYEGDFSGQLHLAFVVDGREEVAGVCVRTEDGIVVGEVFGEAAPEVVRRQVGRVLSLDVDGRGFGEVGERDPTVGRLQARYPGLRPVLFYSPYEAAAWAIIGNRVRITQAARIKARMAEELGRVVEIHGRKVRAFPGPSRLTRLEGFSGLSERKVVYLRRLAEGAIAGKLDADRLRSVPVGEALARLKKLPGIGPFGAELILARGVGEVDLLPTHEPRLGRAVALAHGLEMPPGTEELEEMAEIWRPYRTWVSFLLRVMLEDETGEIAGRGRKTRGGA